MRDTRLSKPLIAFWFVLCASVAALADDPIYTTEASFIGGAGGTASNADYTLISSWRQPIQTSVSTGGEYKNVSGFLAALTDTTFRIRAYGFTTNPPPYFQVSIPTLPGQTYAIQYADSISGPLSWRPFFNTNQAVGTYHETNTAPAVFTFKDDFTATTSGDPPPSAARFYRVIVNYPASTP